MGPNALVGRDAVKRPKRHVGRPEDDHMRHQVGPFYGAAGISSFITSARLHAKGVTPGIADMLCFFPRLGVRFDHEVKLVGDRQSHAQLLYQESCIGTGHVYVLGDLSAAEDFLIWLGVAEVLDRPHSITGERIVQHVPRGAVFGPKLRDREELAYWHRTEQARRHQERWGWIATVAAVRRAGHIIGRRG
jgi:hypothetical protein